MLVLITSYSIPEISIINSILTTFYNNEIAKFIRFRESSLLAPEESVCRGSRVDIKLSTINENAREEDGTFENQDVDDCAGSGVTSKNIVVSLESQSCANGKVAL